MNHSLVKITKLASLWFWRFAALLIIGTVILLVIGRQTIGSIDQLRPTLQSIITDSSGLQVNLGRLQGEWPRLVPILDVEAVEVIADNGEVAISLDHGRANLDVLNSLKYGSPIWRELTVDRLVLNVREDRQGRWNINGLDGESKTDLKLILDPLFYSRLIRMKLVIVNLEFFSGKQLQMRSDEVRLENDSDFHRAELSLRLSDQETPAYLLLEGVGDPSDLESFHADGYLQLNGFNISQPVVELTRSLLPQLFANLKEFEARTSGELWFDIHPGGGLDFEGELAVSEVPLDWLAEVPPLENIYTGITGWFTPGSDWGLRLQGFDFAWSDSDIKPLDMVFTQRLGSRWRDFDVSVNRLDLNVLTDLLRQTRLPADRLLNIIDQVRPEGSLRALTLGQNEKGYYASANLQSINMQNYKGAPALKGVDGYLEVHGQGGLFHIADSDGFDVWFTKVYRDYLHVDSAEGTIYLDWQSEQKTLKVESEPVKTVVDAGTSHIMFSVEQQFHSEGLPPEVNLVIGGRDIDASYSKQYLPYKMPETLRKWLKTAIVGGNVKDFALAYRAGAPRNDVRSRTSQMLFRAEDTAIDYHPDWPGLRDLDTEVLVDDGYVQSSISSGLVGDNTIVAATAEYDSAMPPEQRILIVDGTVTGSLAHGVDFLAQSPVKKNLGPLASWDLAGKADSRMQLRIPLGIKSKNTLAKAEYTVSTQLADARLAIPDSPIAMTEVNGDIKFSAADGLQSDNITATFWQEPLTAKLYKTGSEQKIAIQTEVKPESIGQLVKFPWPEVLVGNVAIDGLLSIPPASAEGGVNLALSSQLQGTEIRLPEPLALSAADQRSMNMTIFFTPELARIETSLGEELTAEMYFSEGALTQGLVLYDRADVSSQPGELLVAAYMPTTDLQIWMPVVELFSPKSAEPRLSSWEPVFDLNFDRLELATFELNQIEARISASDRVTQIAFNSDLADGLLELATDEQQVPRLSLSRLHLPSALLEEKIGQQTVDPRTFFAVDLSVDQLRVGDKDWGSIALKLRPEVSGAAFNNISGNLLGLRPGLSDAEPPTEFFWSFDGETHSSRLIGPVAVDNIGDMFVSFDIDKVVDSESGKLTFDLAWQEKPWGLSRENITGDFDIKLTDGSFYKSAGGAGGALKLVSLFNFANWLRRLQLDFSDVVGQNLEYNRLKGKLHFENGVASLRDPLKMNMPSGRMSMAGDFDLVNETVDTRLVATLPVATNLPWVVAMMGGLPAAAGVYVTSKLVEKQVDRLSSISYEVTGPWDDVKVSVDKIFAAELKGTSESGQPEKDRAVSEQTPDQ